MANLQRFIDHKCLITYSLAWCVSEVNTQSELSTQLIPKKSIQYRRRRSVLAQQTIAREENTTIAAKHVNAAAGGAFSSQAVTHYRELCLC